ncbi:uncharacterized protein LOC135714108 [Ochlerotatus camptorhynchus]|uniref:uncharacterized protein LOC135714108 n=1 Tax=Ochlerotatus camptorhynchus TaxID=644619 RepID=UPI0031CDF1C9
MDLLRSELRKATEDGPTLQNTEFGCIVGGKIPDKPSSGPNSWVFICSTADLQDQLTKFWNLETCRSLSTHSLEDFACEAHFNPIKRFKGMERRFAANPELEAMYGAFIQEYLTLGHMKEVTEEDEATGVKRYCLPHYDALKLDSTTSKLRVVFDASCHTSTGICLNGVQ